MDDQQDGRGIVPWLAEWLNVRMDSRPMGAAATDEVTWAGLQKVLAPDALGVFFTLLTAADSRKEFEMHPDDVLNLLAMTAARFDAVTKQLVELGLIETSAAGESVQWRILREPVR